MALPVIRENDRLQGWAEWLTPLGLDPAAIGPGPTYRDGVLCLDAAMPGQGVFMAWETLARGQVFTPFPDRRPTGAAYWFVASRFSARKPTVAAFRTWLQAELDRSVRVWRTVAGAA